MKCLIFVLFTYQGLANALKFMEQLKEMEDECNEKLNFLSGCVAAFKQ